MEKETYEFWMVKWIVLSYDPWIGVSKVSKACGRETTHHDHAPSAIYGAFWWVLT